MRTILIYVHDLRSSGVVVNAASLARHLAREHHVILVAGHADGLFGNIDIAPARLEVLRHRRDRWPRLAAVRPLRRLIAQTQADAIISNGNFGHLTVWLASAGSRIARLYTISNEIGRGDWRDIFRFGWARLIARDADRLHCVGRTLYEAPLFDRVRKEGRAVHIANAVDLPDARRRMQVPPPHHWLAPGQPPVILAIGRLNRQKNLEGLIRAFALLRQTREARLILLGGGPAGYRAQLQALAETQGGSASVLLAGETDNVFGWLAHAALFALPSHWEGSSTALLEAMAVNIPVLASHQAGDARWVLVDGAHGVLVDATDDTDIARGMQQQLSPGRDLPSARADDFCQHRAHRAYAAMLTETLDARAGALQRKRASEEALSVSTSADKQISTRAPWA